MKYLLTTLAIVLGWTGVAGAQSSAQVHVRGTVAAYASNVLTVAEPTGPQKIALAPNFKVAYVVKSDFAKVAPGSWIGCTAVPEPDGSLRAVEIHIFPPGLTPGAGSRPYDLGPTSSMTNGSVGDIDSAQVGTVGAHSLTITYPEGKKTVVVTPATAIVTYAPADPAALVPGAHVILFATRAPDGSLSASSVNVGKDGLVPPM